CCGSSQPVGFDTVYRRMDSLVGKPVAGQYDRTGEPPLRTVQQVGETGHRSQESEIRRTVGLQQRELVKPLPDVPPLTAAEQCPAAGDDVQVAEPSVAHLGSSLLYGTTGDGSRRQCEAPF